MLRTGQEAFRDPSHEQVLTTVQQAMSAGQGEIWIDHEQGRTLAVVLGGTRAMVMFLPEPDDAGHHAIDPTASTGDPGEYLLANGQIDRYADCDTIDVPYLPQVVTHFLATTDRWPGVPWVNDGAM